MSTSTYSVYVDMSGYHTIQAIKEGNTVVVTTLPGVLFSLDDGPEYTYQVLNSAGLAVGGGILQAGPNYCNAALYTIPADGQLAPPEGRAGVSPLVVELLNTSKIVDGATVPSQDVHIYGDLTATGDTSTVITLAAGYRPIDPISITALRYEIVAISTGAWSISGTALDGSLLANGIMSIEDAITGLQDGLLTKIDCTYPLA